MRASMLPPSATSSQPPHTPLAAPCRCQLGSSGGKGRRAGTPRPQPVLFGAGLPRQRRDDACKLLEAAAAESSFMSPDSGAGGEPAEAEAEAMAGTEVFPRRKERDPRRRLGVSREASFEEIEDAKNYLVEQYRWHAESRESIELAYDMLLQEHLKRRHKYGFKPPKTGRKSDVEGDAESVGLLARAREALDPAVSRATLVNDGSIFVGLAIWTAFQATVDPTLPLGAAMAFCVWRLFDKRKKRAPDGPFWGNSPIWGALATTVAGLLVGGLVSWAVVTYIPLPRPLSAGGTNLFLLTLCLGMTCIFLR